LFSTICRLSPSSSVTCSPETLFSSASTVLPSMITQVRGSNARAAVAPRAESARTAKTTFLEGRANDFMARM
jgi:hypothetical protein